LVFVRIKPSSALTLTLSLVEPVAITFCLDANFVSFILILAGVRPQMASVFMDGLFIHARTVHMSTQNVSLVIGLALAMAIDF
jgi:hypothetical protein